MEFFFVNVDPFSLYIVTATIRKNIAGSAVHAILHRLISSFDPPQYLITDKGNEFFNSEMANRSTLFNVRYSPRTWHASWKKWLVEVREKTSWNPSESVSTRPLKTSLSIYFSSLMLTKVNIYHTSIIHHMKKFFIRNRIFHRFFN